MNITIIRRACWVVAALAFGYVVFAYWTWRPVELLIAAGIFIVLIPVDILLHGEEVARRSPRHGPVLKWGYQEPAMRAKSPYFREPK